MKTTKYLKYVALAVAVAVSLPALGQDKDKEKKDEKQPSDADMMAMMMELAKPGENHKLLAKAVGSWTYTLKMWMDPSAPPSESSGTCVTKEVLGGRYFITDYAGKFQFPGPDGKMMDMEFKGIGTDGYDNVKKKFVSSWIDNMGTMIIHSEGTYDGPAKSLTYNYECEMMPGMKTKNRQVIKIIDNDNRTVEFWEDRGGKEVKTMEIVAKRKK
jgi:hypothetical protein